MISLHPRTRAQDYGGQSDWSRIADLVSRLSVPVCGSGDLYTPEDAERMLRETGCAALMFARGAMGNPFIFTETRSLLDAGSYSPAPAAARIAAAFRPLELLAADIGEHAACREKRKHYCAYITAARGRPGLPNAAALRRRLVQAETIPAYQEIFAQAKLLPR
jgi:tRNA-dihydrouridine synthase